MGPRALRQAPGMSLFRELLFLRRHRKACSDQRASEAARSLAKAGVSKRHRAVTEVARQIRRELGLPVDPRLA